MAIQEVTTALTKQSDFDAALVAKIQEIVVALGARVKTADLIVGGKIKADLLPFALNDLLSLKGALDLVTTPNAITSGSGKEGDIWIVSADATGLLIDAITEVKIGDWVISIDGKWNRLAVGAATGGVAGLVSFNGRTAANVVPALGDYTANLIAVAALQYVAGATVQEVLVDIDAKLKANTDSIADLVAGFTTLGNQYASATTAINAIVVA